jgi:hypothetical protein
LVEFFYFIGVKKLNERKKQKQNRTKDRQIPSGETDRESGSDTMLCESVASATRMICASTSSNTEGCATDRCAHLYARRVGFTQLGINDN